MREPFHHRVQGRFCGTLIIRGLGYNISDACQVRANDDNQPSCAFRHMFPKGLNHSYWPLSICLESILPVIIFHFPEHYLIIFFKIYAGIVNEDIDGFAHKLDSKGVNHILLC